MSEHAAITDELLLRLRGFRFNYFPPHQLRFRNSMAQGRHPQNTVFRLFRPAAGALLADRKCPGELFIVHSVGARSAVQRLGNGWATTAPRANQVRRTESECGTHRDL